MSLREGRGRALRCHPPRPSRDSWPSSGYWSHGARDDGSGSLSFLSTTLSALRRPASGRNRHLKFEALDGKAFLHRCTGRRSPKRETPQSLTRRNLPSLRNCWCCNRTLCSQRNVNCVLFPPPVTPEDWDPEVAPELLENSNEAILGGGSMKSAMC